jgi:hypothetical protein
MLPQEQRWRTSTAISWSQTAQEASVQQCVPEYQTKRRCPTKKVWKSQGRRTAQVEEDILEVIQIRRNANEFGTPRARVWRTARDHGLYPLHIENVQAVQPNYHFAREEFCHWPLRKQVPCAKILFTNEPLFNKNGITSTWNSHVLSPQEESSCSHTNTFADPFQGEHLLLYYRKHSSDHLNLKTAWLASATDSRAATAIRCASGSQAGDVAAARWRNCPFWRSRPLDRREGGAVTWPARSPDFEPMDY